MTEIEKLRAENLEWLAAARELLDADTDEERAAAEGRLDALRIGSGDVHMPPEVRRSLLDQLAAETEARRKAEAERDSERDKAAANYASCERLRAERDTARAELEAVRRERDDWMSEAKSNRADVLKFWGERDRAEAALATATGAMERAISALERIESRTDELLTAGFARAEANALRTALAAPPPSPSATREGEACDCGCARYEGNHCLRSCACTGCAIVRAGGG